jgi:hypothetical protein
MAYNIDSIEWPLNDRRNIVVYVLKALKRTITKLAMKLVVRWDGSSLRNPFSLRLGRRKSSL